jgi:VacB/RNase II family 3'-5' exoribonuclease
MNNNQTDSNTSHREILKTIANREMIKRGFLPDFSAGALAELDQIKVPAQITGSSLRDMRDLLWCSIDNDDSLDLDQLTVAEALDGDQTKIFVAISDVDALVHRGTEIDNHGLNNTTSIYTAAEIFPMLPEKLSTNLTSLNFAGDRLANVVEMIIQADGTRSEYTIYPALVRNKAKLAYNSVAAWLEGSGPIPEGISSVPGLQENLRLQDKAAQCLQTLRHTHGALSLETIEAKPVFDGDVITGLEPEEKNRAKTIIEDFMIAANSASVLFLTSKNFPSIRRVVRVPKRWDRIVEIARENGTSLPDAPDSQALEAFLTKQQVADPLRFPDLSLTIIKLLGAGEYVAELPATTPTGHFGLAVRDYTHSTAPNRRYPDLVTQRLLKSALAGGQTPYTIDELQTLATHFTQKEDDANKVERQVGKSAAALLLEHRIGETFDAIITGASDKGTWARLLSMPVEGKLVKGFEGEDVGNRLRVQLISVDVDQGFIDFRKAN